MYQEYILFKTFIGTDRSQKAPVKTPVSIRSPIGIRGVTVSLYQSDKLKTEPSNNKFLVCVLKVKADYIVFSDNSDNHLLELRHFRDIQIFDAKIIIKKIPSK